MGLLDDLWKSLRGKASDAATDAATKAATAAAGAAVRKAVGDVAEDFLSFAEGELDDARKARGLDAEGQPAGSDATDKTEATEGEGPAEPPPLSARERREAAEAKAREELARLKAAAGKTDD